jgi:2'-5' RNA ligase
MDDPKKWNRYFIAIVLPEPFAEDALKLKEHFRDTYGSKAALRSPPHITLHMPFQWRADREAILIEKLQNFCASCKRVQVNLKHFGCFLPRVIFIDVEKTPALTDLHNQLMQFCRQELNLFNATHKGNPFNPHVTLAFRDLKKAAFALAWKEFKERKLEGSFIADRVALLRHSGKVWEVLHQSALGSC